MVQNHDPIHGPLSRQAIGSLRGYQYQIIVSAIAWCQLQADEVLFLEVAEDYAHVLRSELTAHQVKHSAGNITSNSQEVVDTIDSLFQLSELNPDHNVTLRHLTTAAIAEEQRLDHRTAGMATLKYWAEVAKGADVTPLRSRLSEIALGSTAREFLSSASNEDVRHHLVRRIEWVAGCPGINDARERLRELLILHGDRHRISASQSIKALEDILGRTMRIATQDRNRRLTLAEFLECFDKATSISVPAEAAMTLLSNASMQGREASSIVQGTSHVENMPARSSLDLARRPPLEAAVAALGNGLGFAWLHGATGHGKTIAAAGFAYSQGGSWRIARLRGLERANQVQVLNAVAAVVALDRPDGIVLDDLLRPGDGGLLNALAALVDACGKNDCCILVTSQDPLGAMAVQLLGLRGDPEVLVRVLDEDEVKDLVAKLDGDPRLWARYIHVAAGGGHPQLAHALAADLARRGWPKEEFGTLEALLGRGAPIEQVRQDARRRLQSELPDSSRRLLFRMTLAIGALNQSTVDRLADVDPRIDMPGEALEPLIGPWVEQTDRGYRCSPLVSRQGSQILGAAETERVHYALADAMTSGRTLDGGDLDAILTYCILGRNDLALVKADSGLLTADPETFTALMEHSSFLKAIDVDKLDNFPGSPAASEVVLRLQVLAAAALGDRARFERSYQAFEKATEQQPESLRNTSRTLVQWKLSLLDGFIDLVDNLPAFILGLRHDLEMLISNLASEEYAVGLPDAGPTAVLLPMQMAKARTVAALLQLTDQIGLLSEDDRRFMLSHCGQDGLREDMLVRNPWMIQHRRGETPSIGMAEEYVVLGRAMARTGLLGAAVGAFDTAAVLFDEHHGLGERALAVLDEAKTLVGHQPMLLRARARVLYHSGDFSGQLAIAEGMEDEPDGEPVGQAFFLRDTAIGTSLMGRYADAANLFGKAARIVQRAEGDAMRVMGIGLRVDRATELYRTDERSAALQELWEALVQIEDFDLTREGPAVVVHAILAHCAMVMRNETSGSPSNLGDIAGLVAGAASNPAPAKELTKPKPPGFEQLVWFQLASLEQRWEMKLGIANQALSDKFHHQLSTGTRALLVTETFMSALRRRAMEDIASFASPAVRAQASMLHFGQRGIEMMFNDLEPMNELVEPSRDQMADVQCWLLAGFCDMALTDGSEAAERLLDRLYDEESEILSVGAYDAMRRGRPSGGADQEDQAGCVGALLHQVRSGASMPLAQLCIVSLRCAELFCIYAKIGGSTRAFAWWLQEQWSRAVVEQAFRLTTPVVARPGIERIIANHRPTLEWVFELMTVALPFCPIRIAPDYLKDLRVKAGLIGPRI